jgi:hypothetical protein
MVKRRPLDGRFDQSLGAVTSRRSGPKECILFILVKSTIVAAALATTVVSAGAAGAAYSAEPLAYSTATAAHLAAPPPNHKFRGKFRTQQDCQRQAQRAHPGRAGDWECRQGHDKNSPWEYWGA